MDLDFENRKMNVIKQIDRSLHSQDVSSILVCDPNFSIMQLDEAEPGLPRDLTCHPWHMQT